MALRTGDRGFLHLSAESFSEPRWREAVIVAVDSDWVKTLVRCTQEELGSSQLSALEHGGAHYCLVEAQDHQLRLGAQGAKMLLDADSKVLVAAAKQMLDSTDEELLYATASEPGRKKSAKTRAKPKKKVTENSESSSGSSSQAATDTDSMLEQLRKSWLGSGMQKESRKEKARSSSKRRGQRFSLLSKKKEDSEGEPESKLDVTTSLIEAAVKAEDPLRGLLALQLAQVAKPRKKKGKKSRDRRRSRSTDSSRSPSSGTSDSGSSSSDQQGKKVTPER